MVKQDLERTGFRPKLVFIAYSVLSFFFVARLFSIQVLSHSKYRAMAQNQYGDLQELPAKRGTIYTREGFPLATTELSYFMYAEPRKISSPADEADKLAQLFSDEAQKEIQNKKTEAAPEEIDLLYPVLFKKYKGLMEQKLLWVGLQRGLPPGLKDKVEALKIEGIGFEDEPERYYPEGNLGAHFLGIVAGNEKGENQGYEGIEGTFDGELRGKPGRITQEKDALGEPILVGNYTRISPINGSDIYLTIDRAVQYIAERRLKEGVEKYDAVSGSIVIMDPFTGDVVALANYPTYDPKNFNETDDSKVSDDHRRKSIETKDLAISDTYEPGSVIKGLTISTALDLGKVKPETTYEDNGPVKYSDYYINNWDGKHWGTLNIIRLLQLSNNIGAAWVGHQVGEQSLHDYFEKFGLGSKTGIDLEGEDSGILRKADEWTEIDLATASFGQGLSATPLQVLNAFNVLANGGKLMRPRIVWKIVTDGKNKDIPVKQQSQVISKDTSDTITGMLVKAVDGGEAKYFNLKTYSIAGKTGTAQIPVNGHYDPKKTNATFVGYLSGTKKFSMIVRLNEPTTSVFAAETAVPLWMSVADDLVKYYGIPQDRFSEVLGISALKPEKTEKPKTPEHTESPESPETPEAPETPEVTETTNESSQ